MGQIQWKNPKNKQWTLFDADKGKIIGTQPERFEGVPLAASQSELELNEDDTESQEVDGQEVDQGQSVDDQDDSITFF